MTESNKKKILIVDDNPDNITLLMKHLHMYDFETTMDGESALALIEKNKPDLIILDIMIPGMDGFTISKRLKQNAETSNIPILFVSAKTNVRRLMKDSSVHPDDFIEAPYDVDVLRQVVKKKLSASEKKDSE
jgi:putative two-component system response regulator